MFGVRRTRTQRALRAAAILDALVDEQLSLFGGLSECTRSRLADNLAELVELAASYRSFACGSIGKRELAARASAVASKLGQLPDGASDRL